MVRKLSDYCNGDYKMTRDQAENVAEKIVCLIEELIIDKQSTMSDDNSGLGNFFAVKTSRENLIQALFNEI